MDGISHSSIIASCVLFALSLDNIRSHFGGLRSVGPSWRRAEHSLRFGSDAYRWFSTFSNLSSTILFHITFLHVVLSIEFLSFMGYFSLLKVFTILKQLGQTSFHESQVIVAFGSVPIACLPHYSMQIFAEDYLKNTDELII